MSKYSAEEGDDSGYFAAQRYSELQRLGAMVTDLESTLIRVRRFCQKQCDANSPEAALWAQAVELCMDKEERQAHSQFGVGA